jgi:sulfofructose kinase
VNPSPPLVLGFGENSIDHVYRLQQYPLPHTASAKIAIDRHDVRPGGQVATTLATCARLGLATRYAGTFGDDENGRTIRAVLEQRGVDVGTAMTRPAANRYAIILLDVTDGERVVLWQRDRRLGIQTEDVSAEWLDGVALVHVDATDEDAAIALARLARERGLPVTCDVDRVTPSTMALLEAVTIPILAEHLPLALTGETDPDRALRKLRRFHPGRIVVTRGPRGAAMLDDDRVVHSPGFQVPILDSTGAGDVFRGAFIYALLRGDETDAMLRFANAAGAISCSREGAIDGVPELAEIERLIAAG